MHAPLPPQYRWLMKEQAPRILMQALSLHGIKEKIGPENNPTILGWAKEIGGDVAHTYKADAIPWCGLFMGVCCVRAGLEVPATPLWALSWAKWGIAAPAPMLGDVLVFKRDGGGHVGIYVGEDPAAFHVLGGNQGDAVSITRISRQRFHAARRTAWVFKQPENVRRIQLQAGGELSQNEA